MAVRIINDLVNKVKDVFKSKEYRHAYADEFLNLSIATQIKVLREQRKWTQTELGNRIYPPMKQTRISIMENVNYSSWSINTLRKLAEAFDLRLRVSFESFGSLVKEVEQFSRNALERHSFDTDPVFIRQHIPLSTSIRVISTTSTANLAIIEANKDLMNSNEIIPIGLEPKEASGVSTAYPFTKKPIITPGSQSYAANRG
jgi:transcriptional regulator with XRE-family HTH domain